MTKTIIYRGSYPFKYYLINLLTDEACEVSEEEFFSVIGYDRDVVPMYYDEDNINRQNFFLNDNLIGYRERRIPFEISAGPFYSSCEKDNAYKDMDKHTSNNIAD